MRETVPMELTKEKQAMRTFTNFEKQAFNLQHPKKAVTMWYVKRGTVVLFENTSIKLCNHFIRVNSLNNLKPTSIK